MKFLKTVLIFGFITLSNGLVMAEQVDYFMRNETKASAFYVYQAEVNHLRYTFDRLRQGMVSHAIGEVEFTLNACPNHPTALQYLATLAKINKNHAWAIRWFEQAIRLYPQYPITHAQYGNFLIDIDDVDAGMEKLNYAVEKDPNLAAGYAFLAKGYTKKKQADKAREAAQKAKELGYQGPLP